MPFLIPQSFVSRLLLAITMSLLLAFSTIMASPIVSSDNSENNALKDLLLELEAINPVIAEAQRRQDHQDRFRFDYRCLVADLKLVKHSLRVAIYSPKTHLPIMAKLCVKYGNAGQQGGEAESLQLLKHELQALTVIIHDAKTLADQSQKIQFNYPVLESDIDTITTAIELALLGSGNQPRSFPPLRGAYSQ